MAKKPKVRREEPPPCASLAAHDRSEQERERKRLLRVKPRRGSIRCTILGEGSFQEFFAYFIGKLTNLRFKALAGALNTLREAGSDVGDGLFGFFPCCLNH